MLPAEFVWLVRTRVIRTRPSAFSKGLEFDDCQTLGSPVTFQWLNLSATHDIVATILFDGGSGHLLVLLEFP